MQPTPFRLSQTLHIAFRRARPSPSSLHFRRNFIEQANGFIRKPRACINKQLSFPRQGIAYYSTRVFPEPPANPKDDNRLADFTSNPEHPLSSLSHSSASPPPPPRPPSTSQAPLPSTSESSRSPLSRRLSHSLDHLQTLLLTSSRRLNDLTGYTAIESLKIQIAELEKRVAATRAALLSARTAYTTAVSTRSTSQREVNALLQRKHAWSSQDLERFTALYRSDHANEVEESRAQEELGNAEREAEEVSDELRRAILARYHEEQIWSDKIRRMSTWGTWGLMAVNVLLFLVFQVAVEPWRRQRLVSGFEEKVREAIEGERGGVRGLNGSETMGLGALKVAGEGEEVRQQAATAPASDVGTYTEMPLKEAETLIATPSLTDLPTSTTIPPDTAMTSAQEESTTANTANPPLQSLDPLSFSPPSTENAPQPPSAASKDPLSFSFSSLPSLIHRTLTSYRLSIALLFSDRPVLLTQKDVTIKTLEGFVGGAAVVGAVVGGILVFLRPR